MGNPFQLKLWSLKSLSRLWRKFLESALRTMSPPLFSSDVYFARCEIWILILQETYNPDVRSSQLQQWFRIFSFWIFSAKYSDHVTFWTDHGKLRSTFCINSEQNEKNLWIFSEQNENFMTHTLNFLWAAWKFHWFFTEHYDKNSSLKEQRKMSFLMA